MSEDWMRFRLQTFIESAGVIVSSVGDMHLTPDGPQEEIGFGRTYETMVFRAGADGEIADFGEIDFAPAHSEAEVRANHEAICAKWRAK